MQHDPPQGRVLLVGAGPGPADLLTVRALKAAESAQALLYDALVSDEVVALAPRGCIRIQTGKRAGRASMAQCAIDRLMLRLARRGLRVVRLKGGDPSVFGRVGEEAAMLQAAGVPTDAYFTASRELRTRCSGLYDDCAIPGVLDSYHAWTINRLHVYQ